VSRGDRSSHAGLDHAVAKGAGLLCCGPGAGEYMTPKRRIDPLPTMLTGALPMLDGKSVKDWATAYRMGRGRGVWPAARPLSLPVVPCQASSPEPPAILSEGGRKIVHECPIDRMPVFVRAGSIIPTGPKMDHSDQAPLDPLTLDVYVGRRAAAFSLYEDDGISLEYRKGAYAQTAIALTPAQNVGNYTLTVGPTRGEFQGRLQQRRYAVRVHGLLKPSTVVINHATLPEAAPNECGCHSTEEAEGIRPGKSGTTIPVSVASGIHSWGTRLS
jgi:hypothetical protein